MTFDNGRWNAKIIDDRELFDDSDMCEHAQDIPVVEADGTTHINKGLRSRLALTDDQKELVAQYEDICKKLIDAKVGMTNVDEQTYAYNCAEVEQVTYAYSHGELYDCDDFVDCVVNDFCTKVKSIVSFGGWDNSLYVALPKKNEE